jgi:uncharacterized protein
MHCNKSPARSEVRRRPDRALYRWVEIAAILDESFLCHAGLVADGVPVVIPMVYGRAGETLYLHGSPASRLLKELPLQTTACVTVTLVDGLVLARSAPKHSVNYRSVVAFGTVSSIGDAAERQSALQTIIEHVLPGRSEEARPPTPGELAATNVVAFRIEEVSAKRRAGPPVDDRADYALPIWAGELPLRLSAGTPAPDRQSTRLTPPESLRAYGPGRPAGRTLGQ